MTDQTKAVTVPREPTEAMIEAGKLAGGLIFDGRALDIWSAMLAAAPPVEGGEAVAWLSREDFDDWIKGHWPSKLVNIEREPQHYRQVALYTAAPPPAPSDAVIEALREAQKQGSEMVAAVLSGDLRQMLITANAFNSGYPARAALAAAKEAS